MFTDGFGTTTQAKLMPWDKIYQLYQELQRYVGWTDDDAKRVGGISELIEPHIVALIDDFYEEIDRHPEASKVITGGAQQVARLKQTLRGWLRDLVAGRYDKDYVSRRWRVGLRHVEIGLSQVFTNAALSRLRRGLLETLERVWTGDAKELLAIRGSLNLLLDLDLAIIEDAYQTEFSQRQQRSDRLAAIGQVAGGVAHELRNPLNVVKTSVYYLLNTRSPAPAKVQQHLERIERQIGLADRVITALSDFARLPVPELHPVSVPLCLKEVLELNPLPTEITVISHYPENLPSVLGDVRQLQIVFSNLVRNARDAMLPQGGSLTITAQPSDGDVEVIIADSGTGIPRENLERIMEPLYSTKARGIGLGLAITRSIIEKHGGGLHVASEPGVGSRFTVRLPAVSG
ncbi:MAG TPA: protoglobin domain-containing protein [Pirellulales bacterium]|nr:protoglobin domain-containing protein [Pirellulales bacterium]